MVLWQAKYQKQEKEADGVGKETVKMKVKNQSAWNAVHRNSKRSERVATMG